MPSAPFELISDLSHKNGQPRGVIRQFCDKMGSDDLAHFLESTGVFTWSLVNSHPNASKVYPWETNTSLQAPRKEALAYADIGNDPALMHEWITILFVCSAQTSAAPLPAGAIAAPALQSAAFVRQVRVRNSETTHNSGNKITQASVTTPLQVQAGPAVDEGLANMTAVMTSPKPVDVDRSSADKLSGLFDGPLDGIPSSTSGIVFAGVDVRYVSLVRRRNEPLGLHLNSATELRGVVISGIAAGTAAADSGKLLCGDVVVEVNGKFLLTAPPADVTSEIKASGSILRVAVAAFSDVKRAFPELQSNSGSPVAEQSPSLSTKSEITPPRVPVATQEVEMRPTVHKSKLRTAKDKRELLIKAASFKENINRERAKALGNRHSERSRITKELKRDVERAQQPRKVVTDTETVRFAKAQAAHVGATHAETPYETPAAQIVEQLNLDSTKLQKMAIKKVQMTASCSKDLKQEAAVAMADSEATAASALHQKVTNPRSTAMSKLLPEREKNTPENSAGLPHDYFAEAVAMAARVQEQETPSRRSLGQSPSFDPADFAEAHEDGKSVSVLVKQSSNAIQIGASSDDSRSHSLKATIPLPVCNDSDGGVVSVERTKAWDEKNFADGSVWKGSNDTEKSRSRSHVGLDIESGSSTAFLDSGMVTVSSGYMEGGRNEAEIDWRLRVNYADEGSKHSNSALPMHPRKTERFSRHGEDKLATVNLSGSVHTGPHREPIRNIVREVSKINASDDFSLSTRTGLESLPVMKHEPYVDPAKRERDTSWHASLDKGPSPNKPKSPSEMKAKSASQHRLRLRNSAMKKAKAAATQADKLVSLGNDEVQRSQLPEKRCQQGQRLKKGDDTQGIEQLQTPPRLKQVEASDFNITRDVPLDGAVVVGTAAGIQISNPSEWVGRDGKPSPFRPRKAVLEVAMTPEDHTRRLEAAKCEVKTEQEVVYKLYYYNALLSAFDVAKQTWNELSAKHVAAVDDEMALEATSKGKNLSSKPHMNLEVFPTPPSRFSVTYPPSPVASDVTDETCDDIIESIRVCEQALEAARVAVDSAINLRDRTILWLLGFECSRVLIERHVSAYDNCGTLGFEVMSSRNMMPFTISCSGVDGTVGVGRQLEINDYIVSINGKSALGMGHHEAVGLLSQNLDMVELFIVSSSDVTTLGDVRCRSVVSEY